MFNKRLRESRVRLMLTQQYVADYLDLSLNAYQKYEQGTREPSLSTLVRIANLFDVSLDYLLCRDNFLAKHADERQIDPPEHPIK